MQLAARLASEELVRMGQVPATAIGAQALAARASHEVAQRGALTYFTPVREFPGFVPALVNSLHEVRAAQVTSDDLSKLPRAGHDLSLLLAEVETQLNADR